VRATSKVEGAPATSRGADVLALGPGAAGNIAWEEIDTGRLAAGDRAIVGATWRERMKQEHLAVGAFALLAQELAEVGCGEVELFLVARAASDEVRHAEICRRLAVALLGEAQVPRRFRGLPRIPRHEHVDPGTRVLLHVVEMCCLSETLTGVYLTEMLARATEPVARAAVKSLLADEIDHGRVGWAYLTSRARQQTTQGLAEALPAMLDRTFDAVLSRARRAAPKDDTAREAFGYLSAHAAGVVYQQALDEVILPGFETLNIDLTAARGRIGEREWLVQRASG
jgi:hypothetical protein